MSDFIGIDVNEVLRSSKVVQAQLASVAPAVLDGVVDGVSEYLLSVFKLYPPPNHNITRKQAYGVTFFTAKQRRWFFWALNSGILRLPYRRTQGMRNAWRQEGKGAKSILVNETQAAVYTMGDNTQARFSKLVGWKTLEQIVTERRKQIEARALAEANKAIRRKLPK